MFVLLNKFGAETMLKNRRMEAQESESKGEILDFMMKHPKLKKLAKRYEKNILALQKKIDGLEDPPGEKEKS